MADALFFIIGSNPNGPPITNTRFLLPDKNCLFKNEANSTELISLPCSSSKTITSPGTNRLLINTDSAALCSAIENPALFFNPAISTISKGTYLLIRVSYSRIPVLRNSSSVLPQNSTLIFIILRQRCKNQLFFCMFVFNFLTLYPV